jgi:hypothetical protein
MFSGVIPYTIKIERSVTLGAIPESIGNLTASAARKSVHRRAMYRSSSMPYSMKIYTT